MTSLRLALLAALALNLPLHGQASPEAAAEAFGASLRANDWPAAARLMHPDALHQLRGLLTPLVSSAKGGELGKQLFGVASAAELASTPDTVLFAAFLGKMLAQQGLAEVLKGAKMTPLGHVNQPGDTVLVVSRMVLTMNELTISSFDVMPFLPYKGAFRGLLKADFTNLITMLQARLGTGS
jgi:hypothetical protein